MAQSRWFRILPKCQSHFQTRLIGQPNNYKYISETVFAYTVLSLKTLGLTETFPHLTRVKNTVMY